ncbi:MAG: DUF1887 family CARF protein [Cyanobacteria bacterium P01_G01_bin.49]
MQNLLNSNLMASAVNLFANVPTPLMPHQDNSDAVLAGLIGEMTAGSTAAISLNNRPRQRHQAFDPVEVASSELKEEIRQAFDTIKIASEELKEEIRQAFDTFKIVSEELKEEIRQAFDTFKIASEELKEEENVSSSPSETAEPSVITKTSDAQESSKRKRRQSRKSGGCRSIQANGDLVVAWLKTRDIEVLSHNQTTEAEKVWDSIARERGRHDDCQELVNLHNQIRKNADRFRFNLSGKSQEAIRICTQYAHTLNQAGMLASYHYDSKNKMITGSVFSRPDIRQFLNGGWFERYTYQQVSPKLAKQGKVDCLINPVVRFPNGNVYELDLLFLVDNQPFWVECKSGNHWNECLPKYCQRREVLGIDKKRSLLVSLELNEQSANNMTAMWEITVTTATQVTPKIEEVLKLKV